MRNGRSVIGVERLRRFRDPLDPERIVNVFVVVSQEKATPTNPITLGSLLAITMLESKCNAPRYKWREDEPFQSPIKIHLLPGAPPLGSILPEAN